MRVLLTIVDGETDRAYLIPEYALNDEALGRLIRELAAAGVQLTNRVPTELDDLEHAGEVILSDAREDRETDAEDLDET
jgi:hypothetical protein